MGKLGANLGSTWANLKPTGANMQQLGVDLGPTRANMVARGQLGVTMYLAKPAKLVFRLDGNTIFQNCTFHRGHALEGLRDALGGLGHALGERLGRRRLGRPWGHLGGSFWRTLEKPWKNLLEEPSESTLTPKTARALRSTSL